MLPADPARDGDPDRGRAARRRRPSGLALMFFFSNRMGCLGSLVVSVVGTVLLLVILGVINLG